MEKLTQKWAIATFFDEFENGFEFDKTETPLHVTIAGVFAIDFKGSELYKKLFNLLKNYNSYVIKAGEDALWGVNQEIRVVLIEKTPAMSRMQMQIYEFLCANGAVFNNPQYEGAGHILHSTVQKSGRLVKGETATINKVSIVDMFPNSNGNCRRIIKTIYFNGSEL